MNELPLPIWFFLLYPLCWIVLFPVLTLWSSLLYLAASRFDRNSLPPCPAPASMAAAGCAGLGLPCGGGRLHPPPAPDPAEPV